MHKRESMNYDYQKRAQIRRTATVATVIIVAMAVVLIDHVKREGLPFAFNAPEVTTQPLPTNSSASSASITQSSSSSAGQYKDGTFAAQSNYRVPHSVETIKVTLVVKNGVVTDSQVQNSEGDGTSAMFQESFASEYKSYVVGKNLAALNLDVVAGASDTSYAFDQALDSIRSQAQG